MRNWFLFCFFLEHVLSERLAEFLRKRDDRSSNLNGLLLRIDFDIVVHFNQRSELAVVIEDREFALLEF